MQDVGDVGNLKFRNDFEGQGWFAFIMKETRSLIACQMKENRDIELGNKPW